MYCTYINATMTLKATRQKMSSQVGHTSEDQLCKQQRSFHNGFFRTFSVCEYNKAQKYFYETMYLILMPKLRQRHMQLLSSNFRRFRYVCSKMMERVKSKRHIGRGQRQTHLQIQVVQYLKALLLFKYLAIFNMYFTHKVGKHTSHAVYVDMTHR